MTPELAAGIEKRVGMSLSEICRANLHDLPGADRLAEWSPRPNILTHGEVEKILDDALK